MSQVYNNALDYFYQGNSFFKSGQYQRAIFYYEKTVDLAPNFSGAHQMRRKAENFLTGNKGQTKKVSFKPNFSFFVLTTLLSSLVYMI